MPLLIPAGPATPLGRLRRRLRGVRRAVLARRRPLAAALVGIAVAAGLHTTTAPAPATVSVLVARRDLAAGRVLVRADLVTAQFAPATVPAGIADRVWGRTLAAPLRRGEPVTDVRLVGPALAAGYPGLVAVPVRMPDAAAVGLLAVGDRIDLLAADPRRGGARVLVPAAAVLALPTAETEAGGLGAGGMGAGGLGGRLVVLGVPSVSVPEVADSAVQDFLSYAFSRYGVELSQQ